MKGRYGPDQRRFTGKEGGGPSVKSGGETH